MGVDTDRVSQYGIRAVDRVCDILDAIQDTGGRGSASEIAVRTRLPKSTAMRYLLTLESRGYVHKNDLDGSYTVGIGLRRDRNDYLAIARDLAHPLLERLRDDLGETANLCVLAGSEVLYLDVVQSRQSIRHTFENGMREALHATAAGKAIASQLPVRRAREILSVGPLKRFTDATITSPDDFMDGLNTVIAEDYALDDGERTLDGTCLAVPVRGLPVIAALSISAPAFRLPESKYPVVVAALHEAAAALAKKFQAID